MNTVKRLIFLCTVVLSLSLHAQNKVTKQIMETGKNDNRTMQHLDILTNRIGGRPVGSDAYTNATYWVAGLLEKWGLRLKFKKLVSCL